MDGEIAQPNRKDERAHRPRKLLRYSQGGKAESRENIHADLTAEGISHAKPLSDAGAHVPAKG